MDVERIHENGCTDPCSKDSSFKWPAAPFRTNANLQLLFKSGDTLPLPFTTAELWVSGSHAGCFQWVHRDFMAMKNIPWCL